MKRRYLVSSEHALTSRSSTDRFGCMPQILKFSALGFIPSFWTLLRKTVSFMQLEWSRLELTLLFFSLSFLIRRAVHSPAVAPLVNSSLGFCNVASAIILLFSARGRRTAESCGRVKKATEYLSKRDCCPGGGLVVKLSYIISH